MIAYVFGMTILVLGVGETAVRQLHLAPPYDGGDGDFVSDPIVPFKPRPNLVAVTSNSEFSYEIRHNSLGFRDEEHSVGKPPDTFRVLALGDSFTYGVGVPYEDTYLRVVERMANARQNKAVNIEIVKMGVPRYSPEPERLLLHHYGMQYKPDLILVAFLPNDVIDTSQGIEAIAVSSNGHLVSREASSLGRIGLWLYSHSHIGRILVGELTTRVSAIKHPKMWDEVFRADGFHEDDWRKVEAEYERMNQLANQLKAKLILINIPQNGDLEGDARLRYPSQRLAALAARQGIIFVDILPAMIEAKKRSTAPLYWEKDAHCTAEGYRVIGEALFNALVQEALFP